MYNVLYANSFKDKYLKKLPRDTQERIRGFIENRLRAFPHEAGEPLRGEWQGYWKARVGDYRIVYEIQEATVVVLIVKIDHRKDVYL